MEGFFNEKLPRTFHGQSISVSDVLVLNEGGVVTSYYVEKDGFTVIAGFIQKGLSWVVLDEEVKLAVDHAYHGFDQSVQQQIKDYLNPAQLTAESQKQEISDGHI